MFGLFLLNADLVAKFDSWPVDDFKTRSFPSHVGYFPQLIAHPSLQSFRWLSEDTEFGGGESVVGWHHTNMQVA